MRRRAQGHVRTPSAALGTALDERDRRHRDVDSSTRAVVAVGREGQIVQTRVAHRRALANSMSPGSWCD